MKLNDLVPRRQTLRNMDFTKFAPLLALVVLVVISAIASPYFLSARNLTNLLRQSSYFGIIALGMTFIIASEGIDLSVGSMVAFVGGVIVMTLNYYFIYFLAPFAILFAVITGMIFGALIGAFNGFLSTVGRIAPFVATLATMSIFRSLSLYLSGAGVFRVEVPGYAQIGSSVFLGIPVPVWIFAVLAVLANLLLNNTRYGRYLLASGANEQVARYSAIKVQLVKFVPYALTGFAVAVSAILVSSRLNSINSTNAGLYYELDAIASVVIGGTPLSGGVASIWGTVIGAIILGVIGNMLNLMGVSPYLQGAVRGLVIIAAVSLQYKRQ
ncbi:MAG: ABC transporter permease [Spirochaetia bacterium]